MISVSRGSPSDIIRLQDEKAGLDGVIAIHSTARGPAAGGCRLWVYDDLQAASVDAIRLAEGMSYKNAMAELPFGGGKAVLRRPPGDFDHRMLFEAFGKAVERLGGRYVTAEDVGTSVTDMEIVARHTRYVAGRTAHPGKAGGDPSPWTAIGVFEAMAAAAKFRFGGGLNGMTVAMLGVGSVGLHLCKLLHRAGVKLIVADIDPLRAARAADTCDADVIDVTEVVAAQCEIFAPCALGGTLDDATLSRLRAPIVCGAANNQLALPETADHLLLRGISYVPDYVANAGGIINVAAEYLGESEDEVRSRVTRIGPRVTAILEMAAESKLPPSQVADHMAEQLMKGKVGENA